MIYTGHLRGCEYSSNIRVPSNKQRVEIGIERNGVQCLEGTNNIRRWKMVLMVIVINLIIHPLKLSLVISSQKLDVFMSSRRQAVGERP